MVNTAAAAFLGTGFAAAYDRWGGINRSPLRLEGPTGWRWDDTQFRAVSFLRGVAKTYVDGSVLMARPLLSDPYWLHCARLVAGVYRHPDD